MSLYVIHAGAAATVAADNPVIRADELAPLRDALELLTAAGRLKAQSEADAAAASSAAHEAGYAAGHAAGMAAAESASRGS